MEDKKKNKADENAEKSDTIIHKKIIKKQITIVFGNFCYKNITKLWQNYWLFFFAKYNILITK